MSPDLAVYYAFYSSEATPVFLSSQQAHPEPTKALDHDAALVELQHLGCGLATKEWVENHWGLILWKLAGMVCLDPESERDPARKRWCWREVISQLQYRYVLHLRLLILSYEFPHGKSRYERELNRGERPPLRKIVATDVASSAPMVLCVSKVTWTEGGGSRGWHTNPVHATR